MNAHPRATSAPPYSYQRLIFHHLPAALLVHLHLKPNEKHALLMQKFVVTLLCFAILTCHSRRLFTLWYAKFLNLLCLKDREYICYTLVYSLFFVYFLFAFHAFSFPRKSAEMFARHQAAVEHAPFLFFKLASANAFCYPSSFVLPAKSVYRSSVVVEITSRRVLTSFLCSLFVVWVAFIFFLFILRRFSRRIIKVKRGMLDTRHFLRGLYIFALELLPDFNNLKLTLN